MPRSLFAVIMIAIAALAPAPAALAADCTGFVVNVRPIEQYNPARGSGFLAVRTGPGTRHDQIGELYAGDEVSVLERQGNWYLVRCVAGRCTDPLRGNPRPVGWSFHRYLNVFGNCP